MLVRIKGKMINDEISFDFPAIFFKQKSFVCLQSLVIKFKIPQNIFSGQISTTLIDRSPINPEQIIKSSEKVGEKVVYASIGKLGKMVVSSSIRKVGEMVV